MCLYVYMNSPFFCSFLLSIFLQHLQNDVKLYKLSKVSRQKRPAKLPNTLINTLKPQHICVCTLIMYEIFFGITLQNLFNIYFFLFLVYHYHYHSSNKTYVFRSLFYPLFFFFSLFIFYILFDP